jgi:hypothetical protein
MPEHPSRPLVANLSEAHVGIFPIFARLYSVNICQTTSADDPDKYKEICEPAIQSRTDRDFSSDDPVVMRTYEKDPVSPGRGKQKIGKTGL